MYLPGKILKTGKAWNPDYPVANATSEAWVIDMNQTAPTWRQVPRWRSRARSTS